VKCYCFFSVFTKLISKPTANAVIVLRIRELFDLRNCFDSPVQPVKYAMKKVKENKKAVSISHLVQEKFFSENI
jgi:hypothetical protein